VPLLGAIALASLAFSVKLYVFFGVPPLLVVELLLLVPHAGRRRSAVDMVHSTVRARNLRRSFPREPMPAAINANAGSGSQAA
jgi:hypothetical protein